MSKKGTSKSHGANKSHAGPKFNTANRESLNRFEEMPYWESLRKDEPEYESNMRELTSTKGLSNKRPPRKPLQPELMNQIMDTINTRKSMIEEHRRENPTPQVRVPERVLEIKDFPTEYKQHKEDYNVFGDNYVEKQKERYMKAKVADEMAKDLYRYQDVLKTGIYTEDEGVEVDEPAETLTLQAPVLKKPERPRSSRLYSTKPSQKRPEVTPTPTLTTGPTITLKLDEDAVSQPRSRRGTTVSSISGSKVLNFGGKSKEALTRNQQAPTTGPTVFLKLEEEQAQGSTPASHKRVSKEGKPKDGLTKNQQVYFSISSQKGSTVDSSSEDEDCTSTVELSDERSLESGSDSSILDALYRKSTADPDIKTSSGNVLVQDEQFAAVHSESDENVKFRQTKSKQSIESITTLTESCTAELTDHNENPENSSEHDILSSLFPEAFSSLESTRHLKMSNKVSTTVKTPNNTSSNRCSPLSKQISSGKPRPLAKNYSKKTVRFSNKIHVPIISLPGEATCPSDDELYSQNPTIHKLSKSPEAFRPNLNEMNKYLHSLNYKKKRIPTRNLDFNKFLSVLPVS